MKCVYCQEKSGFLKGTCRDCQKLVDVLKQAPKTFGYGLMLDALIATRVDTAKIQKFLDTDVDGRGTVNDQITARMTNEVMASMGTPTKMTSEDVKKVRTDIAEGRAPSLTDGDVTAEHPHKH